MKLGLIILCLLAFMSCAQTEKHSDTSRLPSSKEGTSLFLYGGRGKLHKAKIHIGRVTNKEFSYFGMTLEVDLKLNELREGPKRKYYECQNTVSFVKKTRIGTETLKIYELGECYERTVREVSNLL